MLRIRPEHLDAAAVQQKGHFVERMMAHLREVFAEEVAKLNDDQLRLLVGKVCQQGEEWEIVEETQVERLLELFVCFEDLRRRPLPEWVQEIVEFPDRPGEEILQRLEDACFFGDEET
jgi:hypothetical protein